MRYYFDVVFIVIWFDWFVYCVVVVVVCVGEG